MDLRCTSTAVWRTHALRSTLPWIRCSTAAERGDASSRPSNGIIYTSSVRLQSHSDASLVQQAGWLDSFQPFTVTHGAVVIACAAITCLLIWLRRSLNEARQRMPDRTLGWAFLIAWFAMNIWWLLPRQYNPRESWPLHLCDISALIAPLVLLTQVRWLRALLYFWGLGLNTQGFITPLLKEGPSHVEFWLFWLNHWVVVGFALYDLIARRFRPRWRDYGIAVLGSAVYLAVVLPFDIVFGMNYGYLGDSTPDRATIVDVLGPWPWRIGVIAVLACLVMALLMLPWELALRLRRARSDRWR